MKGKKITLLLALFTLFYVKSTSQTFEKGINSLVSPNGLFFDGQNGVHYEFGQRITPHGSCIDVVKRPNSNEKYIFLAWWQGGISSERKMRLSRRKLGDPTAVWQTIEFPDVHFGFRGDPSIGDSHNTIAVGVCPSDGTVHLAYDMHAYANATQDNRGFNYRISKKNAAWSASWSIDLFYDKKTALEAGTITTGTILDRVTYPDFTRENSTGRLFLIYRLGGSGAGETWYAYYNQDAAGVSNWSEPKRYNVKTITGSPRTYSIYGNMKFINGKFVSSYSIRFDDFDDAGTRKYAYNYGIYYSYLSGTDWKDFKNITQSSESASLTNPVKYLIHPVIDENGANAQRITDGPECVVTPNNAIHFIVTKDNVVYHYLKKANKDTFETRKVVTAFKEGEMFGLGTDVYMFTLQNNVPVIYKTAENESNWTKVWTYPRTNDADNFAFRHGNLYVVDDSKLVYFYMKNDGTADSKHPIHCLEVNISNVGTPTVDLSKEATVTLFPNPVNQKLNIEFPSLGSVDIAIYNSLGQVVFTHKKASTSLQVDVSRFVNGQYVVNISNSEISIKKAFVKSD